MRRIFYGKDGSAYVFDEEEFRGYCDRLDSALNEIRKVPEILSRYEDTERLSQSPDYVKKVLEEGFGFIRSEREQRIRESLKDVAFGRSVVERMIEETLDEIPSTLEKELLDAFRTRNSFDDARLLHAGNLAFTVRDGLLEIGFREGLIDEVRKGHEHGIRAEVLEDYKAMRSALEILWGLSDKGYDLRPGSMVNPETGAGTMTPSVVDLAMTLKKEERGDFAGDLGLYRQMRRGGPRLAIARD